MLIQLDLANRISLEKGSLLLLIVVMAKTTKTRRIGGSLPVPTASRPTMARISATIFTLICAHRTGSHSKAKKAI